MFKLIVAPSGATLFRYMEDYNMAGRPKPLKPSQQKPR